MYSYEAENRTSNSNYTGQANMTSNILPVESFPTFIFALYTFYHKQKKNTDTYPGILKIHIKNEEIAMNAAINRNT